MTRNKVDVIIISDAKNENLLNVTKRGLESLLRSSVKNTFNIVIIESQKAINYDSYNCYKWDHKIITHHPTEEFGYNKYLNIGINMTDSPYVALCNSDLIFRKGWSEQIISVMEKYDNIYSASPWCNEVHGSNEKHLSQIYPGFEIRKQFCGWCILQKRSLYDIIGPLDEGVRFWFSDNILSDQISLANLQHVLVPASVVNHHSNNIGKTAETLTQEDVNSFTSGEYNNYITALNKLKEKMENGK